jgi:hypothetical protein
MSIEKTNNLFHFEQTNTPDKSYIKNNKKNTYYDIAYPFSKIIKLKHEPEADPENKPVQYNADMIVEIKIEMAMWYPGEPYPTQEPHLPFYYENVSVSADPAPTQRPKPSGKHLELLLLPIMNPFWI